MLDTILGFKQKMGAVYINDRRYPVTWVKVEPCVVTQIKYEEKDGYMAVQLGTGSKRIKNVSKPLQGHLKKSPKTQDSKEKMLPRFLREVRVKEDSQLKVGDEVKVTDVLRAGDVVTITGISKGKGFAGVVKRWGFAGGPKTHGQSDRERAPGSIGNRTSPGRVFKGKRMAGRMGSDRVTVKNLNIIDVDEKNSLIAITGAVPGAVKSLVFIKKTGEGGVRAEAEVKEVDSTDAQVVVDKQVIEEKKEEKEVENKENKNIENEENKKEGKEEPKNSKTEKLKGDSAEETK